MIVRVPYFSPRFRRALRAFAIFLVACGLLLILLARGPYDRPAGGEPVWGAAFSKPYAEALGLNWQDTYRAVLDDLKVKRLRLFAYWSDIEPQENVFDFADLDWQLDEAERRGAAIILGIGRRLPRWPECHVPAWAQGLSEDEQQERILAMLRVVVERYRSRKVITAWQVENEPFVAFFGICPEPDESFFRKEVALVRSLDPAKKIIVTDSGELGWWFRAARYADTFGTTMYRIVPRGSTRLGYASYPIPAWFYRKKANLVSRITTIHELIVTELQAEPWAGEKFIADLTLSEQEKSLTSEQLQKNIDYARRSGIHEIYLWGTEWWYWAREHGRPDVLEIVRPLFQNRLP